MAEKDAHVLEVLICQMGQCRDINPVLSKTLRVLGHAEPFEPVSNLLHWRPPTDLARYPCWTGRTGNLPHAPTYCSAQGKALRRPENYARPRDSAMNVAVRGRITLISVYSPGCVSTSIDPECCFTMMSWVMDRPRPVPSPAGFVVKKGLNILSLTSGGMPVPLSRILISTQSPRSLVEAVRAGSYLSLLSCCLRLVAA